CLILNKSTEPCATVVGVVEDTHRMGGIEEPATQFYRPIAQTPVMRGAPDVVLRGNPTRLAMVQRELSAGMRREIPNLERVTLRSVRWSIDRELRPWRLGAELFMALAVLALVVAAVGVYSVVA